MSTRTRTLPAGAAAAVIGLAALAAGKTGYARPDGALAATGADIPWWAFAIVGLALVAGVILLFMGGRRRNAGPDDGDDVVVPARSAGPTPAAPSHVAGPEPVVDPAAQTAPASVPEPVVDPSDTATFAPEAPQDVTRPATTGEPGATTDSTDKPHEV